MALLANCVGRVVKVDSACGCTLTRTTVTGLDPAAIEALAYKEIALTKAILNTAEAKMLGVPENPLMMLLNGRTKDIKVSQHSIDEQSIVMPFIQRTQRSVVNANYFTIVANTAIPAPGAGTGAIPASAWQLTVGLGNSPFQTTLTEIERYFVPGQTLIVKTWDTVDVKTARTLVFTIYSAANADSGGNARASVIVYPPVSAANWATYTANQKAVWRPYFGMVEIGANSIANEESHCQNQPSDLSKALVVNWLQTTRESYCREAAYEQVLNAIMKGDVNDYLKMFKYQSIAEQQKQMKARYDTEWFNSVFWGQAIDVDNQTVSNWQNLPIVYDVANGTCPLAYKASALGIFTQLGDCNRVRDYQGLPLDLVTIFSDLYYLRRNREASGDRVPVIDSYTDRHTSGAIFEVMAKYFKAKYGVDTTRFAKFGEKIMFEDVVMFEYDIYDVKEAGVQWAVFQLDYFNDLVDAYNVTYVGWNFQTRANNLWMIDWSDISIGVAKTTQVTRKSPNPNTDLAAYQCVISPNVKTYDLRSKLWTVMVDRPQRHMIYHNYRSGCPAIQFTECSVPSS